MSFYSTDLIEVTPISSENEYGEITEGPSFEVVCQVEDVSELMNGPNGEEITSNALIIIDDPAVDVSIGDTVVVKERWSELTGNDTEYKVIRADKPDGFSRLHTEVWI